jgi:hypothetical protein
VQITSGYSTPELFVIVPPVGLHALAAHNANCPLQMVSPSGACANAVALQKPNAQQSTIAWNSFSR